MDGLTSGDYTLSGVSDYAYLRGHSHDIFLLGEIHEETTCQNNCKVNCYTPVSFIQTLAQKRLVDIFVEATYHKSYSQVFLPSPMTDFIKKNSKCLVNSKNAGEICNLPNTRLHPVNIRVNGTVLGTLFNICLSDVYSQGFDRILYESCISYLNKYDLFDEIMTYYDDLLSLRQMSNNRLYRADLKMMVRHVDFASKYQKRYLHVIAKLQRKLASLQPDIREKLKEGFLSYLQTFSGNRRLFSSLRDKFEKVLSKSQEQNIRLDKYMTPPDCDSLIFIFSLLQDLYTAARIYSQPQTTSVVYVGGVHVVNMAGILKPLSTQMWSYTRAKNCLKVSGKTINLR